MKDWSKSTLLVYRYLERMTKTIDKMVLNTGRYSNHHDFQRNQTTMYQTSKIIELMDRKRKMINLKVAVEDVLASVSKFDRRILSLAFIDGVTSELIAQLMGISLRTFFRRKIKALEKFTENMIDMGYNLEFFEREYSNENWIMSVYLEVVQKGNRDDEILNDRFVNKIMNEVPKVNINRSYNLC